VTASAPPPRDPELAADPDYRQAAAEDWQDRVAGQAEASQAEVDREALYLAAEWDPAARQAYLDQFGVDLPDPDAPEPEADL
jgi:hypothetical protein